MPTERNRHGLKRYIPADVAREVRNRCGFGCIFCRSALIEYDHFDPEFKDAHQHAPDGIVALCGTHHTARGNGQISAAQVREKLKEIRDQPDISRYTFELRKFPKVEIGRTQIFGVRKIIEVDGENILSFDPPDIVGSPPLLNAKFYNRKGILAAEIVNNEWRARIANWDVVVSGDTYTVRSNQRKIALQLRLQHGVVKIKQLNLKFNHTSIKVSRKGVITVQTRGNDGAKLIIPNIHNETKEWLHWIKVAGKEITWCTENIHELLRDVPDGMQPLAIADTLNFGPKKLVAAMPRAVKSTGDPLQPYVNDVRSDRDGFSQKLTLIKIGLCPHSFSTDSTMYVMETKRQDGHVSTPCVENLEWAKLAREAVSLIESNPNDTTAIHRLFDSAISSMNRDCGKLHQWAWLMAMKIQACAKLGRMDDARMAYDELSLVAPEYAAGEYASLQIESKPLARGT